MKTRKNSSNMGEFTFEMRLSSEQIEQLWELTKQDPTRRSIIARMDDGSYRVLGEVVKLPACPQEEFDKALEMMSEHANGFDKEQSQWKPSEAQLDALWAALGVTDYVAGAWIENGGERSLGMSKDELHERLISLYKDLKDL